MKKSIYLQIFVFAIIVALMGSINNYGQNSKSKYMPRPNEQNRSLNDAQLVVQSDSKGVTNYKPTLAVPLPVIEDFERVQTEGFPPTGWTQTDVIWDAWTPLSGYGIGLFTAGANFWDFASGSDELVTVEYISTGTAYPKLAFDWAYATAFNSPDELDIYYSVDNGTTWVLLLAMPGGLNGILNPFNLQNNSTRYVPTNNQWSTKTLDLPQGTDFVKFTAVSAYGNMLWLDNIKIGDTFFDTFENPPYAFPGQVACQNPDWITWTSSPCSNDDATISTNYAFSGTQSALIDAPTPRVVDLVKVHGTFDPVTLMCDSLSTGKWYIAYRFRIPAGKSGYFNVQADFTSTQDGTWGLQCYYNAGGLGSLEIGGTPISFPWAEDNWNNCLVIVDLNTSTAEFWIGRNAMSQLAVWSWTRGGTEVNSLDGVDFFGGAATDEMYIDNFYFSNVPPPIPKPVDEVGILSIDTDYQFAPGTGVPKVTVKNFGTDANSFNVEYTITGGYTSTRTVSALAPGATQQVTFDTWTETAIGTYTGNVCTQLTGDEEPANDCAQRNVSIWDENGTWSSGATSPIATRNGVSVGYNSIPDDYVFYIGGSNSSGIKADCNKYNVTQNNWTPIAPLPVPTLMLAGAGVGDNIYVMGGNVGTNYVKTAYVYNITSNTWAPILDMPDSAAWVRATAYNNRYIYVAGGVSALNGGFYLDTVFVYDVISNTWATATSMPVAAFGGAFATTGNTLVYAGGATPGGITDDVMVGTISLTDPTVITWTVKKIFPAGTMYRTHASTWGDDAIIMGGGTPTADYVPANPGPVYVYKPSTDTWTAQENMITQVGAHQSATVFDGSTWKYVITSGYTTGAYTNATQIYTKTLGATTFGFSVPVLSGWNMVSAPGTNPAGMGVATWWPRLTGTVFGYNGIQYIGETVAATGKGYWMNNTIAETYSYTGIQVVAHAPIPTLAGWNMLGGYENSPSIVNLKAANSCISGTVFGYNGIQYVAATNLVPGNGYWVFTTSACQITIPDALSKGSGEVVELFKENWGRIVMTDARGISTTLYAVKGKVDLEQYKMPPLPPSGSFDIRFSSQKIAEDINGAMKTIDMVGVVYPLTVRVEGMDIRLQDVTGKAINQNLKSGEDVVISDATINKLMVTGELIPAEYALEQNYPNPFNPSTMIEFSLPEDVGNVKLSIYNTLGEKVAELVNTALTAGKYQYQWNAQNVATGMYIYELRADKFVSVKKMLLVK